MSKTLVLATSAAVALGSFVAASDADARHVRGFYRDYGHARACIPRRSYADPMFAPNGPPPCSYANPGLPDFQLGSRGWCLKLGIDEPGPSVLSGFTFVG